MTTSASRERTDMQADLAELQEARGYRLATPALNNPASQQRRSEWLARNAGEIRRLQKNLLEQLQRESASWKILAERANEQRYELMEKLGQAEAQLAAVPALVEAGSEFIAKVRYFTDGPGSLAELIDAVDEFTAKWEQAQEHPIQFCGRTDLSPHTWHHWWRLPDGSYGDEGEGGVLVRCPGEQAQGEKP